MGSRHRAHLTHFRQAGAAQIADLAPAAIVGLLKAWRRGNASGAIEVLRALGFLKPPTVELDSRRDRDIDVQILALVDAARNDVGPIRTD